MTRPGPARKDPKLVALEGNRGKRNRKDQPVQVGIGLPPCPKWLLKDAKTEWARVGKLLEQHKMVTPLDLGVLAAYCQSWARLKQYEGFVGTDEIEQNMMFTPSGDMSEATHPAQKAAWKYAEQVVKFGEQLGLTPPSRSKFLVPITPPEKPKGIAGLLD